MVCVEVAGCWCKWMWTYRSPLVGQFRPQQIYQGLLVTWEGQEIMGFMAVNVLYDSPEDVKIMLRTRLGYAIHKRNLDGLRRDIVIRCSPFFPTISQSCAAPVSSAAFAWFIC